MQSGLVSRPTLYAQDGWGGQMPIFNSPMANSEIGQMTFTHSRAFRECSCSTQTSCAYTFPSEGSMIHQVRGSSNVSKLYAKKFSQLDMKDMQLRREVSMLKHRAKLHPIESHQRAALSVLAQAGVEDGFLDKDEKIGVLLLNLGGPEKLDDVQPFLYNLFADPDIIRLPRLFRFLQRPLAKFISTLRAPKSAEGYASIGGGSPLLKITHEQANALKKALDFKNLSAEVYIGMRYWHPFTEEALEQIKRDGITRLVILPLYPQFSISTSGSSLKLLESIIREDEYLSSMEHLVIPSWYNRRGYVQSMATLIEKELAKFSKPDEVHIFFSAHGVPVSYIKEAGDPYKAEIEESINLIMMELNHRGVKCKHTLAYQSRVGPVEWLKPYTDEKIRELGEWGVKSLLAVPISFVSEHIETLEEIDVEYKELALKSGIKNWGRVPALNCEPGFIADLADAVLEALPHAEATFIPNAHMGAS